MLYTTDVRRETGSFTPMINEERDEKIYNIETWSESECFTPLINGMKQNA